MNFKPRIMTRKLKPLTRFELDILRFGATADQWRQSCYKIIWCWSSSGRECDKQIKNLQMRGLLHIKFSPDLGNGAPRHAWSHTTEKGLEVLLLQRGITKLQAGEATNV